MAYPKRGAWYWRNISRSFTFTPRLSSVSIKQEHPSALANLDCEVVLEGDNAGLVFAVEDRVEVLFTPDGGSQVPLWRGHLKAVEETALEGEQTAVWVLSGQDYTAKLDDSIIRRRTERKGESARRRITWLLGQLNANVWTLAGTDISGVPAGVFMEKHDYFGMTLAEGLQQVADELNAFFYVDFDNVFHMFKVESIPAPFDLDNTSPDFSTSFPFRLWTHTEESTELHNAALVTPKNLSDSRWSVDSESIAAYGRQEVHVADSDLPGPQSAINVGTRLVTQEGYPTEESTLQCWEPGLYAGMTVNVVEGLWGHDFTRIVQSVDIRAVDPHDESGQAYLLTEAVLTDRRPSKGWRQPSSDRGTDRGDDADPSPYTLTDFTTDVSPPALSEGDSAGSFVLAGQASQIAKTDLQPWFFFPDQDDSIIEYPFTWTPGRSDRITQGTGAPNAWTARPSWVEGVAGVMWVQTGWSQSEQWWRMTMGAHPANAAGMAVTIGIGGASGYGTVRGASVLVATTQPQSLRAGTIVATLSPNETRTITIPASLLPAEGADLYIGLAADWVTSFYGATYDWLVGFPPAASYVTTAQGYPWAGYTGSHGWSAPASPTWLTWGASPPELGELGSDPDAPWDGDNTVQDAGTEGDGDAWGVSDGEFGVTNDSPAGKGITVVGARSGDSEGPWGDLGWAHEFVFRITAEGDTSTAGPRHIESTTTGEGERTIGYVHLGDSSYAQGIEVQGPTSSDYAAFDLTPGVLYKAKFDTRSGKYVRGKIWAKGDGEPAYWNVQALMDETEDDDDRWTLWLRAGNNGTEMGVYVQKVNAWQGGVSGQSVKKELIGFARGLDKVFQTAHPFTPKSLRIMVNGHDVAPVTMDGPESTFGLDFWPTAGSIIRATYTIA